MSVALAVLFSVMISAAAVGMILYMLERPGDSLAPPALAVAVAAMSAVSICLVVGTLT